MPNTPLIHDRPQRWDAAFDPEMSDASVDEVLYRPAVFEHAAGEFSPPTLPCATFSRMTPASTLISAEK